MGLALAMLGLAGCGQINKSEVTPAEGPALAVGSKTQPENVTVAEPEEPAQLTEEPASMTPSSVNLDVPFYSQAPRGYWGMPYQEACEEASLLLASYYARGEDPTLAEFEKDLLAMVDWEVSYFGQYEHTSIDQTAEMAHVYLGMDEDENGGQDGAGRVEVVENPSTDDLRAILARGDVIVAPFAGRYLGNPNFTGLGPVYHMLVIRGYKGGYFITNDVGTRHGKNYKYSEGVLMNALHDWHDSAAWDPEGILKGAKKVLVVGR